MIELDDYEKKLLKEMADRLKEHAKSDEEPIYFICPKTEEESK